MRWYTLAEIGPWFVVTTFVVLSGGKATEVATTNHRSAYVELYRRSLQPNPVKVLIVWIRIPLVVPGVGAPQLDA